MSRQIKFNLIVDSMLVGYHLPQMHFKITYTLWKMELKNPH